MFPSSEFYHDRLYTGLSQSWTKEPLPFWPENTEYHLATTTVLHNPANRVLPHVFVDVRGAEETLTVATDEGNERSKSNALEADKVVRLYGLLVCVCVGGGGGGPANRCLRNIFINIKNKNTKTLSLAYRSEEDA